MPAVQHAGPAARPAGWQHGARCAHTAASTWHREPGLADSLIAHYTHTQTHTPSFTPSPVQLHITMSLWTERRNWSSCADTKAAIATAPILTLVSKKGFPDIRSD